MASVGMSLSQSNSDEGNIFSRNNLTLCKANYFETCWCKFNSTEPTTCPYLLRYIQSSSNSSYFCIYHTIRKTIDCFNSSFVYSKNDSSVSTIYIYLTIFLFIIGLIGNGLSIIILFDKKLRRLSVYRNLAILCTLNILYLLAIFIRHINNYKQDIRDISPKLCRLHSFTVAFTGHLCSWQLVSTSIQRVHALLSLQSHRTTSWIQTLSILFICIILPLFIIDGQLLFNYGLFYQRHICEEIVQNESIQLQRAINFPMNNSKLLKDIPIRYHTKNFFQTQTNKTIKCSVCIRWNILDTFIYAIIPFLIILTSSIIIIVKICQRRRSTAISGGICHTKKHIIVAQDNLSILLITINCLFLIMTGPFNICLIIQSILKYFFSTPLLSMKIFLQLNEYLRLLQNFYHALSFIFYCVIGNKFRNSAWSICRIIYYKLFELCYGHERRESSMVLCCLERKRSSNGTQTVSTYIHENNKRIRNYSTQLNSNKKQTYMTLQSTQKRIKQLNTSV